MQTKQLKDPKYIPDSIHIESGVTKTIVLIALGSVIGHLIFPGLGELLLGVLLVESSAKNLVRK